MVYDHSLVVTFLAEVHLIHEALILVDRVVQLRVCVGELLAVDHQLEALCEFRIVTVTLCERRHLYRIVDDECGLYECALAAFAENLVDELSFTHGIVDLDAL